MSAVTSETPGRHSSPAGARGVSFGGILRSEWIKLWSLRSTVWCFSIIAVLSVGLAVLLALSFAPGTFSSGGAALPQELQQSSASQAATFGVSFSSLVAGVIGALVITGEYGTGMIRSTFAAVPTRIPALLGKALVVGASLFALAIVSFGFSIAATAPILPGVGIEVDYGDSAFWLTIVGAAGYLACIGLIAFSLGAIIRNSAGGIAAALGLVLVLPTVVSVFASLTRAEWAQNLSVFLPSNAGARLFAYPAEASQAPPVEGVVTLDAGQGALVLAAWIVVLFAIAALLVRRRDV